MDSFTLTMLHNFVDLCMPDALRIIKLSMHGFWNCVNTVNAKNCTTFQLLRYYFLVFDMINFVGL